jgi:hypothetical protein
MRDSLIIAAAIAAIPSVALAQPAPAPPAAPAPPPAHTPHANLDWNADRFHFDYNDGGCHLAYNYDFKSGDMHLDRHGACSDVSIPHS